MEKDIYKDIEEALLAQSMLREDEQIPLDEELLRLSDETKKMPSVNTDLLDGNTTMYLDAIKDLDLAERTKKQIGSLDKIKNMETTDFLGETDFLGYTDYMEGKRVHKTPKDPRESYEVSGDENDNPLRNVFGLGPKKSKAKSSSKSASAAKSSAKAVKGGARAVKGAANASVKTVSAGSKAAKGLAHFVQLSVRIFSFVLMMACGYQIAVGCYYHREDLGLIAYMIPYKNYAQISFLLLAILAVLFAALSAVRILSARRTIRKGEEINLDHGQGFVPFLLFFLLGVGSYFLPKYLPFAPNLEGVRLFLSIINSKGQLFMEINILGAILCLFRNLTRKL